MLRDAQSSGPTPETSGREWDGRPVQRHSAASFFWGHNHVPDSQTPWSGGPAVLFNIICQSQSCREVISPSEDRDLRDVDRGVTWRFVTHPGRQTVLPTTQTDAPFFVPHRRVPILSTSNTGVRAPDLCGFGVEHPPKSDSTAREQKLFQLPSRDRGTFRFGSSHGLSPERTGDPGAVDDAAVFRCPKAPKAMI